MTDILAVSGRQNVRLVPELVRNTTLVKERINITGTYVVRSNTVMRFPTGESR